MLKDEIELNNEGDGGIDVHSSPIESREMQQCEKEATGDSSDRTN